MTTTPVAKVWQYVITFVLHLFYSATVDSVHKGACFLGNRFDNASFSSFIC